MFSLLPKKMIAREAEKGINKIVQGLREEADQRRADHQDAFLTVVEVSLSEEGEETIRGEIIPTYIGRGTNAGHFTFKKEEVAPVDLEEIFLPPQAVNFVKNIPGMGDLRADLWEKISGIIADQLEERQGVNVYIFPNVNADAPKWVFGYRKFNRIELTGSFSLTEIIEKIE